MTFPALHNDTFLKACWRQATDHTPLWLMRQAGRYLPEYRATRAKAGSFMGLATNVDYATEVTLQPVEAIEVDAAILFSDLLLPLEPMGLPFDFIKGEGPQLERPISTPEDIAALKHFDPREKLGHVLDAIRLVQRALDKRVPLIGFAGAPFTLASYVIEGGPSKTYTHTKAMMYGEPELWHALLDRLAHISGRFLQLQIDAGVQLVQLFDSWAGALNRRDYMEFVQPHSRTALSYANSVPRIHFGVGTGELLEEIGVDSARWYFASRSANTAIDFDIEAATARNNENPVYYAQYAHARMQSILRKGATEGLTASNQIGDLLDDESTPDAKLARVIVRLPEVVEDAAAHHETQGVTTYATELATAFSAFYRQGAALAAAVILQAIKDMDTGPTLNDRKSACEFLEGDMWPYSDVLDLPMDGHALQTYLRRVHRAVSSRPEL